MIFNAKPASISQVVFLTGIQAHTKIKHSEARKLPIKNKGKSKAVLEI
jgi:hypothetical protein